MTQGIALRAQHTIRGFRHSPAVVTSFAALLAALSLNSSAAESKQDLLNAKTHFSIRAQALGSALKQLAAQAGVQILFEEQTVSGRNAPEILADETPLQALTALLLGTGLEFVAKDGTVAIRKISRGPTSSELRQSVGGSALNSVGGRDDTPIEEIIVTAQHRAERLQDVPMGISALSGEDLNRIQARSFEDYVALVPGLAVTHPGLPGANTLTLRGLNAGGVGSTVGVYVDDSPFGSSSSLANGGTYAANIDPWDMQRIEVLRGPQGTLYGASSEGGLIKFVTNAPDPSKFAGNVEVSGNNVAHGDEGWSVKAMLNMPLGPIAAFRLSGFSELIPGYIDDPVLHQTGLNSATQNGVRASLLLLPTDDLSIRLTAFDQRLRLRGTSFVDENNTSRQPFYGYFIQYRGTPEPQRFEYQNYNMTVDWNVGWADLLAISSFGNSNNRSFLDFTYSSVGGGLSFGQAFSAALNVPSLGFGLTDQSNTRKFTQELRLQSRSAGPLEWEVGAFYTHETAGLYQPNNVYSVPSAALFNGVSGYYYLINIESHYKEEAAFATVTYHFNPAFDVQLGARRSHNVQDFAESTESQFLGLPFSVTPGGSKADKFLYSFSPRWHVTDDLMLYARIASGYEAGGPNILPPNSPPNVPRQFDPDTTVNYELGVRSQLFDKRLSIDLTAFRIDWKQVQLNAVFTFDGNNQIGYIGNGGSAKSQGVEWQFGFAPIPDLTLALTGAYIDAKLTADAVAVGGVAGDRLPNSPKWSSALSADYARPAFGKYRAFLGGTWSLVGTEVSNFSSANAVNIPPTRLAGYATADLRFGLEGGPWRFTVFAKNITDKRALVLFNSSGVDGFPGNAIYIRPRTIGAAVNFKF